MQIFRSVILPLHDRLQSKVHCYRLFRDWISVDNLLPRNLLVKQNWFSLTVAFYRYKSSFSFGQLLRVRLTSDVNLIIWRVSLRYKSVYGFPQATYNEKLDGEFFHFVKWDFAVSAVPSEVNWKPVRAKTSRITQTKNMNELVRLVKDFFEPLLSTLAPNVPKVGKRKNNAF